MSVGVFAVDLTTTPVLLGVAVAAVSALAAVWLVPKRQSRRWAASGIRGSELAELENSARTTLVQIVGGVALLLTFAATWMQIADARRATNKTLRQNEQQQVTERFTRAVEELGSPRIEIRLGGIFGLGGVGRDAPHYTLSVVQLMGAYLHRHHPAHLDRRATGLITLRDFCHLARVRPAADAQAAFGVLLELAPRTRPAVDLSAVDLRGVHAEGGDLVRADLEGADLRGARLPRINLRGARLDYVDGRRACLTDADLDGALVNSARFDGADLSGASLVRTTANSTSFFATTLRRADLSRADFSNDNLDGADLAYAKLAHGRFLFTNLNSDLYRTDLTGADLSGAALEDASGGVTKTRLDAAHIAWDACTEFPWRRHASCNQAPR